MQHASLLICDLWPNLTYRVGARAFERRIDGPNSGVPVAALGVNGIGSVIVERDTPRLSFDKPSGFMAGDLWCQLYFENCRIRAENVLLGKGGFKKQTARSNTERPGNITNALTTLPAAFDTAKAKLSCNKARFEVANESLPILGALDHSTELLVAYCVRRARADYGSRWSALATRCIRSRFRRARSVPCALSGPGGSCHRS